MQNFVIDCKQLKIRNARTMCLAGRLVFNELFHADACALLHLLYCISKRSQKHFLIWLDTIAAQV